MRTLRARMRRAASGRPVSWLAPPRQDDALADDRAETGPLDAVAYEFQRLFDASANDARDQSARHVRRLVAVVFADRRNRNDIALVRAVRKRRTVHDLQTLGILDAGGQAARQIGRDVVAAKADGVRMDELAFGENRDRRRTATHVDGRTSELDLVIHECRKPAGIRRRDHALDREVSAIDAELEVLQCGPLRRQHMHVDAENVTEHRQRVADAALAVQREAGRQRVQDGAVGAQRLVPRGSEYLLQIVRLDLLPAEIDRRGIDVALQAAG